VKFNFHSMIRSNLLAFATQDSAGIEVGFEKNDRKKIRGEIFDRLQSYASLKRENKKQRDLMWGIGLLLVLSLLLNVILWFWNVHLHDTLVLLQYEEAMKNGIQ
jgi:hypothetical protein